MLQWNCFFIQICIKLLIFLHVLYCHASITTKNTMSMYLSFAIQYSLFNLLLYPQTSFYLSDKITFFPVSESSILFYLNHFTRPRLGDKDLMSCMVLLSFRKQKVGLSALRFFLFSAYAAALSDWIWRTERTIWQSDLYQRRPNRADRTILLRFRKSVSLPERLAWLPIVREIRVLSFLACDWSDYTYPGFSLVKLARHAAFPACCSFSQLTP